MLEGKEISKVYDGGEAFVDVNDKGQVIVSASFNKEVDLDGYAKAKAAIELSAETDIFKIAEKLCAKTATTWDDSVLATLKLLLGVKS